MIQIDQESSIAIQPELGSGESVLWSGRPKPGVIFHKQDILMIPFSLLWGGFAIFWEFSAAGITGFSRHASPPGFFLLWGVPFVLIGQYLIWGRFIYAAWLSRRTFYAITNRRVVVVQNGLKHQIASAFIDSLQTIVKDGNSKGIGSLRLTPNAPLWYGSRQQGFAGWTPIAVGSTPAFLDIDDVDSVYRVLSEQREKLRAGKSTF